MSSAAKKQDPEAIDLGVDLPTDREQKLSKSFEDPSLDELIPGMGASGEPALSIVEETAAAVKELVAETAPVPLPPVPGAPEGVALSPSPPPGPSPVEFLTAGREDAEASMLLELPLPEAPTSEAAPRALPQTVNFDKDPSDDSLVMAIPADAVEEPVHLIEMGPALGVAADAGLQGRWEMSSALFSYVACESSFDEVVTGSLGAIMGAVGAQAGSVLELDFVKEDFFFRSSLGGANPPDMLKNFRIPCGKGIVGHVAEHRESKLVKDMAEDQLQMKAVSASVGFEAVTCMAAPVVVGDQIFGVIEVFNRTDGGRFNEEHLAVLEDGARLFAKVLEVRFLMAELIRRAR